MFSTTFPIYFPGFADPTKAAAYTRTLKHLLPPGTAFNLEAGSGATRTLQALAEELARIEDRGVRLIDESDPRTAEETLAEWEKMLGLPDEQVPEIPATIAGRRLAITQKYVARGGQNVAFFENLAAQCGYTITVSRYHDLLSECGVFECGEEILSLDAAYSMLVTVTAEAATALSHADFQRVIQHATHSHIAVVFEYS